MKRFNAPPIFLAVCAIAIAVETHAVFFDRNHTFQIAGRELYRVEDFAARKPVSHAFLMRGEGLSAVRTQFASDIDAVARIKWTIFRGSLDAKPMTVAEQGELEIETDDSPSWVSFPMTRDGSSKDRWYTIEVQLAGVRPRSGDAEPKVFVIASQDNPDRGGVLFIDGVRKPGSLLMRADRVGRTLYRRFQAEAEPNLPQVLRNPAIQWVLVLTLHWAFFAYAYAVVARE